MLLEWVGVLTLITCMHVLDSDIKILPHFALGCDINTYWFKFIVWGDNFHNVRSRRDVVHSKTAVSSETRECNKAFKFRPNYLYRFIILTCQCSCGLHILISYCLRKEDQPSKVWTLSISSETLSSN